MDKSNEIIKSLRVLTRGLAQQSSNEIYTSHRDLYHHGETVIPVVEEQLLSHPWDDIKYSEQINMLSGLLSLVNDIDEKCAKEIGEKIRNKGCSAIVDSIIRSITDFSLNKFNSCHIDGVNVYLSRKLREHSRIEKFLTRWLSKVPPGDLDEIERIYLIPETNEDHRGTYMPILCNIMVEWDIPVSCYNPLSYFFLLQIERTLYHEIGHHVHRHTFGKDSNQEAEANQYAANIMRKNHPIFRSFAKVVKTVLGKRKDREPTF